jgi:hypothetical protein
MRKFVYRTSDDSLANNLVDSLIGEEQQVGNGINL